MEFISFINLKTKGSPWTTSHNMGFSCSSNEIKKHWKKIPNDTDILLTHLPPHNILDLAYSSKNKDDSICL